MNIIENIKCFFKNLFQKIEKQPEVKTDPELEAYQKKHQELVDKFYKELGGPEMPSEEEIEDSPKVVEDEALTEVKSLLEGIVPPDIPFSETAIRQYLWEMKRTAGMNEDLFRNDLYRSELDWRLRQW